ncbi:hypothetical protein [Alteromonas facilis]|nr:hypothetical protein [Alteromonas facilis]
MTRKLSERGREILERAGAYASAARAKALIAESRKKNEQKQLEESKKK